MDKVTKSFPGMSIGQSIPAMKRRRLMKKPKKLGEWRDSVAKSFENSSKDSQKIIDGSFLWKVRKKKMLGIRFFRRKFRIDFKKINIHYTPAPSKITCGIDRFSSDRFFKLDMAHIVDVRKGFSTDTFNEVQKNLKTNSRYAKKMLPDNCFSIIFDHRKKIKGNYTLDLVCKDNETRESWFYAIQELIEAMKEVEYQKEYELYLREKFNSADKSGTGVLDLHEFSLLLKQINIYLEEEEIVKVFNEVDADNSTLINESEFLKFYHRVLSRPMLFDVFESISQKYKGLAISSWELHKFLTEVQKNNNITLEECQNIIKDYDIQENEKKENKQLYLSWKGFQRFCMSSSLFHIRKSAMEKQVYQDMTRPLCHYFINTSHNTYLIGNQITSDSSIDGYIRALKGGCKCVELDCWDGPDGDPIIYHGWTLTSKLLVKDVLMDAIKPYSFIISPYPVILSIENHCSAQQQDVMAEHMTNILGDMLYTQPVDTTKDKLPSPEELKNKILLKAKKIKKEEKIEETDNEPLAPPRRKKVSTNNLPEKKAEADTKASVKTQSEALSSLVNYCEAMKFSTFEQERTFWQMSSFEETKARQISSNETNSKKFLSYNCRNLSRIYPKGTRLFSSNLDPFPHWTMGCHMVALNFQEADEKNLFNRAKFLQNGNCGYVLKPEYMNGNGHNTPNFAENAFRLTVHLISGQHLPNASEREAREIIEPYVKINLNGHPLDQKEWESSVIHKNGFNPIWDEKVDFTVAMEDLAILEFKVMNKVVVGNVDIENLDDHLGSYAIAVPMMKEGYRNILLESYNGRRLTPANLFVHIKREFIQNQE